MSRPHNPKAPTPPHADRQSQAQPWPTTAGRPAARAQPPQAPHPSQAQPAAYYAHQPYEAPAATDPYAAVQSAGYASAHQPAYAPAAPQSGYGVAATPSYAPSAGAGYRQPASGYQQDPRFNSEPQPHAYGAAAQSAGPRLDQLPPQTPYAAPAPGGATRADPYASPSYEQWAREPLQAERRVPDLSSYTPAGGGGLSSLSTSAFEPALPHQSAPVATGDWGLHDPYAAQTGYDAAAYGNGGRDVQPAGLEQTYADDEAAYDEPAPRRGRMIAMVLAGAVTVGGSLAYGYSALMGPPSSDGTPPVVRSASEPFKVKPSDAGGKQFSHADSKLMGRLGEGAGADGAPAETDPNAPRRVPVVTVSPDGSIQTAGGAADTQPTATATAEPVPGLSIDGEQAHEPRQPAAVAAAVVSPPAKPTVITAKAPPQAPTKPTPLTAEEPTAAAAEVVPKKPKKVAAAVPPGGIGHKPSGAGYVAVLASIPATATSQGQALSAYADLNAKYGSALTGKQPEVMLSNLGEKGNYHRLIAGPPASLDSVKSLCESLKTAGYVHCWPLAY